jgi:replication-associated recombination protein RarA
MIGFILLIGQQGAGKTLMMTKLAYDSFNDDKKPIYANYSLFGIPFKPITFNADLEYNKNKMDILKTLDKNPNFFNGSVMLLDELHLYLDSLDFMRANNRRFQIFFSQLRKRKILLIGTTQYLMNIDIRIRRQCLNVLEMSHLKNTIFRVDTHKIDGYFTDLVSSYRIDLGGYYNYFDTNELVL